MREFCSRYVAPRSREMFDSQRVPADLIALLGKQKLIAMTVPEEYGGANASWVMVAIAGEEIAYADMCGEGMALFVLSTSEGTLIKKHGTEQLKEEVLPKVVDGEAIIGTGSTEPGCGSDVAGSTTRIEPIDDGYLVNGEKQYVSLVEEMKELGGGFLVIGKTKPELGHRGMSMVYVPIDLPGVEPVRLESMGLGFGGVRYHDVKIPKHYLIGEENRGFYYRMEGFMYARLAITAWCIGVARRALDEGIAYVKEREAFGHPIGRFEAIQFELAEDYSKLEAARWLLYRAAWIFDEAEKGNASWEEAEKAVTAAKLRAAVDGYQILQHVCRWHGAYGYTTDADVFRAYRGFWTYVIGEGTPEVMKLILGRHLLGREFRPF